MTAETLSFQTEVGKILKIVANSLYSDRQIFLRELISNASDACDRLRYLAITEPSLTADDSEFKVELSIDKKAKTLTVSDNGVGMNREALIEDLGTIARSGSSAFIDALSNDNEDNVALIGQFGVGFYSCFMVADSVEVTSRRAGEDQAWKWTSDGEGEFTIEEADRENRGTSITMKLKKDAKEFLEPTRLRHIVSTYSDHISLPIQMEIDGSEETLNQASALWTRQKKDIKPEQYTEFYRHIGHAFDEPATTIHWRAEGRVQYTGLLFIPSMRPMDIFAPERKHGVKLYVKRVFITDDCEGLCPPWLRFIKGLVDSEDLPLNVSREMLQNNPALTRIKSALVKRVLGELKKQADKKPEEYATFWENFGAVLKEGIYEDQENRDAVLKLARFKSTHGDELTSLEDYIGRMKEGQEAIYYISGEDVEALAKSPQLEGFRSRGIEVLFMTDPVDEFWLPAVGTYEEKPLRSATRAGTDLNDIKSEDAKADEKDDSESDNNDDTPGLDALVAMIKLELGDKVKDVRLSNRLTDSPVCLSADEGDIDIRLEQLLRQHNQLNEQVSRVLEINGKHPLITALAGISGSDGAGSKVSDAAWLLLDQARILEGEPLPDPTAFVRRMADLMAKGVAA
ncbi:MAG: molecular chaperone HtpG [Rhodospirillaceae bacterium]|nr:molecular chaperone HtpG [Rhodospirillaceae bacterium]|tara:strand:+ start:11792 stop:13675 length:1884 start_codon:yes stop_codon:yes gene_type:complete